MKRDIRIAQIAKNKNTTIEKAEKIFQKEICKKYGTENVELAEIFYRAKYR